MSSFTDSALQQALDTLSPRVVVGHRVIAPGDEAALTDDEAGSIATTVLAVRRASGAARLVARDLLARLGHPGVAVLKTASGAPAWPAGIVGSLAHDDRVAVAAVARRGDVAALGIDVEPVEPLPADVLDLVATAPERPGLAGDPVAGRLLFAAKEAVYKAVYPLDGVILDFHDITVDLVRRKAVVHGGRILDLHLCRAPRLVVLALVRPDPRESSP
jgi:4'-phosphopantetheinyl transferase EntD